MRQARQLQRIDQKLEPITVPNEVKPVLNLEELDKWNVDDRCKIIIAKGRHPEHPKEGDNSRSVWLFDATCSLVRANVPDEVIFSIITDPQWGISESVVELNNKASEYAIRQIEQAKKKLLKSSSNGQYYPEDALSMLNKDFFVISDEGGKCLVGSKTQLLISKNKYRDTVSFQSFENFRNRWMNQYVVEVGTEGKITLKPIGHWWLQNPERMQYERVVFHPNADDNGKNYNLWRGFAVVPNRGVWRKTQRHIRRILAKSNSANFRYIMKWLAWSIQNPDSPAEVAIVFRGGKGTGKGTLCNAIIDIFGHHGMAISSPGLITGRFNRHLRDCVMLFADEAIRPDSKASENSLKSLITEPRLTIEAKGIDPIQSPNHLHIMMASNDDWVVPASPDERRFAVFDVSNDMAQNKDWFDGIYEELNNGGLEAMLYTLLNLDLGKWHPRHNIPQNEELNRQKAHNLNGAEKLWFDYLQTGEAHGSSKGGDIAIETQYFAKVAGDITSKAAGDFLRRVGCTHNRNSRPTTWITPTLVEARNIWDRTYFKGAWNDETSWAGIPIAPDTPPF